MDEWRVDVARELKEYKTSVIRGSGADEDVGSE